ncbi:MAG: tetratricopeptide repeat protein [SAR324 cluster bacterium]|nr:tetratricopeptide repeat protein [SAR324 cluster bacterium]
MFNKPAKTDDSQIDELIRKGEGLIQGKLYDRAMVEFSRALELNPDKTMVKLKDLFDQYKSSGNYEGLISIGSNLLMKAPNDVELANLLGNAYRKTGNYKLAEKLYERCIKIDPTFTFAQYNLAAAMSRIEYADQSAISAISEFESMKFFKLPDFTEGKITLIRIQKELDEELGRTTTEEPGEPGESGDKAEKKDKNSKQEAEDTIDPQRIFQHVLDKIGIQTEEGLMMMQYLGLFALHNNLYNAAWKIYTRLSIAHPQNENFKCFLAIAISLRGYIERAIDKLVMLLGTNPYNRYANVNLGRLYALQGSLLLSRKYYLYAKTLLDKSRGYYDMTQFRAQADQYFVEGSIKKALEMYEVILTEQESFSLLEKVISMKLDLADIDGALTTYARAGRMAVQPEELEKLTRKLVDFMNEKAADHMRNSRYARAADIYEKSIELRPTIHSLEEGIHAYELLKNDEKIRELRKKLHQLKEAEQEQELLQSHYQKIREGFHFERQHLPYKAINSYEEALRLKPEKGVLIRLVKLYQRTRQMGMIADVTQRYNRLVEHRQRMERYKLDAERRERNEPETESPGDAAERTIAVTA